jgi:hypothetical protein
MANAEKHETKELASRLVSAADGIVNQAALGLERDLRTAAELIEEIDRPMMGLIPKLVSDLTKIANTTSDTDTQRRLRKLIGEA